jgi:hypothetical protein
VAAELTGCSKKGEPDDYPEGVLQLHRLVAFQEMSFTGIAPTTGIAGTQATAFLGEILVLRSLAGP